MRVHYGGQLAVGGVYLNRSTGELIRPNARTWHLPGDSTAKYLKVPAVLAVIAGPLAGLAFIFFLPFIGLAGAAIFLAYRAAYGLRLVWDRASLVFASRKSQ
ncbi:MAG: hypothetical protein HY530_03285 [Chloroflexi bacterium]|nr:hypothetical protein [Chloroflexota bacterium]